MNKKVTLKNLKEFAVAHTAEQAAILDAEQALKRRQWDDRLVERYISDIPERLSTAAQAGSREALVFQWGAGKELDSSVSPVRLDPDSAPGRIMAYCLTHHSDLAPEARFMRYDYDIREAIGMDIWGIFLDPVR